MSENRKLSLGAARQTEKGGFKLDKLNKIYVDFILPLFIY